MIVHRITGDGPIELMVGPMWSVNKWEVLGAIQKELETRGSYQGKLFRKTGRRPPYDLDAHPPFQ